LYWPSDWAFRLFASPLVSAALEPDSQNSYAANRLLEIGDDKLLRVPGPAPAGVWH